MTTLPAPNETPTKREEWHFWRSSPEMLAHVARTALRATTREGEAPPACTIDIEVAGDHEIFASPSDFTANATREGLRGFNSIRIEATGAGLSAALNWRWRRAWWAPGAGKDAEVVLEVVGSDKAVVEDAFDAIRASIKRSAGKSEGPQLIIGLTVMYGMTALLVAATASGLYLLKVPTDRIFLVTSVLGLLGIFGGAVLGTWVYPSLEVAPAGQTHLRRSVKFVGPIVITLIVGGVAKLLYG